MIDSMIERVARALCEVKGLDPDETIPIPPRVPQGAVATKLSPTIPEQPRWMFERGEARAAIAAMREPTKVMLKAKADDDDGNETRVDGNLDDLSADNIWRAMIDAVLEDGQ